MIHSHITTKGHVPRLHSKTFQEALRLGDSQKVYYIQIKLEALSKNKNIHLKAKVLFHNSVLS